jgi:hypothetical protein
VRPLLFALAPAAGALLLAFLPARALPVPAALGVGTQPLAAASCSTRNTLWIRHYAAVLYVPPRASPLAVLEDPRQPKAVEVEILNKTFLPKEMPKRWRHALQGELDGRSLTSIDNAWHHLGAGDRITLAYAPGPGLSLRVNDRLIAAAPSHRLVEALLRTWADKEPVRERVTRVIAKHPCAR